MRLVLASASPARLAVLRAAGVEPVVRVSGVDEDELTAALAGARAEELVAALAEAKARAVQAEVAADHPDAVIVGCDSMLAIDGDLVGKPGTVERARKRWAAMAGGSGVLLTGHAVVRVDGGRPGASAIGTERTTVRFGHPSERELETYLATGEPLNVAGGFTIDGLGGWFIDGIDGVPSSVIGISLPLTRRLLEQVGVSIVDVWAAARATRRLPTGRARSEPR